MADSEARRIELFRDRRTEHSDNRASSACSFRACASFLSAALSTVPSSAKHRSTSSCFALECHTCVHNTDHYVRPEGRRAGLSSARECPGQLLGSASLGQLAWWGEAGRRKGPCFAQSANRAAEAEASCFGLVHLLQRVARGEDPPASLGGIVAQLSAQRRLSRQAQRRIAQERPRTVEDDGSLGCLDAEALAVLTVDGKDGRLRWRALAPHGGTQQHWSARGRSSGVVARGQ